MHRMMVQIVLCLLFLILKNVDCLQQIFSDAEKENFRFNPDDNVFPVIKHHKHCLYTLEFCPVTPSQQKIYNVSCNFKYLCPDGTRPQCVKNEEDVLTWKGILWICSPIKTCDRDARDIVYIDSEKPDDYQLGKKMCPDGFYHRVPIRQEDSYCFSGCIEDTSIRVFQKSTPEQGPLVYCNYPEYCSTEQPNIFEHYASEPSPCKRAKEQGYTSCPADFERLYDCMCHTKCKDNLHRNAGNNFTCEERPRTYNPGDRLRLSDVLKIRQHSSGLFLTWHFPLVYNLTVTEVQVSYLDIADRRETYINQSFTTDTNIDGLVPGKVYNITINIRYRHADQTYTYTEQHTETMRPKPVVNLTVSTDGGVIELNCLTSKGSRQDHFHIEYRMVRRNRKTSWVEQIAPDCTFKLNTPFPGEEYEFKVSAVSNNVPSTKENSSIIFPPLPPGFLHQFKDPSLKQVKVFWFHYESVSHVEKWCLTYISSDGEEREKEILFPDNDNNVVETTLVDLRQGHKYTVFVQSLVGSVKSLESKRIEILSDWSANSFDVKIIVIVGVVVFVVASITVLWCVYRRRNNRPQVTRNELNVDYTVNANRDINMLLIRGVPTGMTEFGPGTTDSSSEEAEDR